MDKELSDLVQAACRGERIGREEGLFLAERAGQEELLDGANEVRRAHAGDVVSLCAIANARSGRCQEDCAFCAQSAHHSTDAPTYELRPARELVDAARRARDLGADAFGLVTSGRALSAADFGSLVDSARAVRDEAHIEVHVSVGSLSAGDVRRLSAAGVAGVNHNLETSERFFPSICTTHAWAGRVRCVETALGEGMAVCSGGIFGLGETWADRVDLLLALRGLGIRRVPVNFLTPIPGTPLGSRAPLSAAEGLRILALARLLMPEALVRTCGGRELVLGDEQPRMFHAGASGTMLGEYLTTPGRPAHEDIAMIAALGLTTVARLRGAS